MKLVLIRHGESEWNLENKFTGWKDVDLSPKGVEEAKAGGKALKEMGLVFDIAYTSYLKRAIKTLNYVLEELDELYIPVYKSWRLNERHYGALQGLNKAETAKKYGDEQVLIWRRSFDVAPPAIDKSSEYYKYLQQDFDRDNNLLVHAGYFSGDKGSADEKIKSGVDEILKDKKQLLSFESPTRFIFSIWALQEGWDNPNV